MLTPKQAKELQSDYIQARIAIIDSELAKGQRLFSGREIGGKDQVKYDIVHLYINNGWNVKGDGDFFTFSEQEE